MTKLYFLSLLLCLTLSIGCNTQEDIQPQPNTDCTQKAFYRGTNVCFSNNGNAAAIELEVDNQYLILSNFSDYAALNTLENGDILYVEFDTVDFNDASPALCGVMIVAPVTTLNCLTVE